MRHVWFVRNKNQQWVHQNLKLFWQQILSTMKSIKWLLYIEQAPSAWFHFVLCGLVGIITAYYFVQISQYHMKNKNMSQCVCWLLRAQLNMEPTLLLMSTKICQLNPSCKLPKYFDNSILYMLENSQYCITNWWWWWALELCLLFFIFTNSWILLHSCCILLYFVPTPFFCKVY